MISAAHNFSMIPNANKHLLLFLKLDCTANARLDIEIENGPSRQRKKFELPDKHFDFGEHACNNCHRLCVLV